jgi:putative membrane protein
MAVIEQKGETFMNGVLGTSASLWSDLSLLLTLVLGGGGAFGGIRARQKRFSAHCPVMAVAAFLNWIPVLVVMIPNWLGVVTGTETLATGPFSSMPVLHGVLGGVTQLLMTYTVIRMYWAKQLPPEHPLWLMRVTMILWLLTVIGGIGVYMISYGG